MRRRRHQNARSDRHGLFLAMAPHKQQQEKTRFVKYWFLGETEMRIEDDTRGQIFELMFHSFRYDALSSLVAAANINIQK